MRKYFVLWVASLFSAFSLSAKVITFNGGAQLLCYFPQQPSGRAIIDCPGGGYEFLAMDYEGTDWASFMNEQGIAYFVLKYRMPNGDRSLPINDAEQAIRMVRDSAQAWHVNPDDVGIMGFSAGGHLAATVSTHAEYAARPNFTILFYPVISMDEKRTHRGSVDHFLGEGKKDSKLVNAFSNERCVISHLSPPAVIFLAADDGLVPTLTNGVAYCEAMRRAGNECAMFMYPSGGHGFGIRKEFKYHDILMQDFKAWLRGFKAPRRDAIRVACVGNSITDGMGIDMRTEYGYPAVLQRLLGEGYYVKNYGVSARTLQNAGDIPYMKELAWRDCKAFLPDVVVIKLGTNDAKTHNWKGPKPFSNDLQLMIDTLRALPSHPAIYLCSPIPAFKTQWTITDSVIVNFEAPAIRAKAKQNRLKFIDLHTLFGNDWQYMQTDGIHPNAKGAERLAHFVAEAIKDNHK